MGNTLESWMSITAVEKTTDENLGSNFSTNKKENQILYFIKNRIFIKFISFKWSVKLFLKYKKLPKSMIENY